MSHAASGFTISLAALSFAVAALASLRVRRAGQAFGLLACGATLLFIAAAETFR